jgi:hypothetical protein
MRRTPAFISSLALLLWTASGCGAGEHTCTLVGCYSGADISLTVPQVDWATTRTWRVEACRNSTCLSGTTDQLPGDAPTAGTGVSFYLAGDPSLVPGALPSVSMTAWQGSFEIQWVIASNGSDGTITDGDRYTVTVTDSSGAVVASIDRAVNYTRLAPNGESCSPICQQARIQ